MLTLDLGGNYLAWVNRETVTLTHVAADGDTDETITGGAKRRPVSLRERAASNGALVASDVNWHLPAALVTGGAPKPRDRITDADGTAWTILEAPLLSLGSRYKCVSRALSIVFELRDLVTIEVPTVGQGDTGGRLNTAWTVKYEQLPARLQPQETADFTERGRKTTATKYTLFVDRQIEPWNDDRDWGRVVLDGTVYEITGYTNAERIDELPQLSMELNP